MIPAGSRETLSANIVQQACAGALLLALPNILSKADYAETVYVGVLLSMIGLADLGLSLVYGRAVPPLVSTGNAEEISRWDETVLGFGTMCAIAFSVIVVALYLLRYHHFVGALLLLPIPLLTFWGSFHVTRVNARGEFREYRIFISARSVCSLTTIPFSWLLGAAGWLAGQCIAALIVVARAGIKPPPIRKIDRELLRLHLVEGLLLALVTAGWIQLINFARLYATAFYPAETIATYGVATAAYQSLAALVVSAFLPITVDILRRFGTLGTDGFERVTELLCRAAPWAVAGALLAAEAAQFMLPVLFPSYVFHPPTVFALICGIAFYPFFICLGNCLVGMRRAGTYVCLILLALVLSFALAYAIDRIHLFAGAAFAQFAALAIYPAALLVAVITLAPDSWPPLARGAKAYAIVLALITAYATLRWVIWPAFGH